MRTFFCIFLFSFILTTVNLQAQTKRNLYTYQAAQVEFWYPSEWQIEEVEKVATLQNSDGSLSITFSIMAADQMEEALIELESIIQAQLTQPNITTDPKIIELNGMMGVVSEVEGSINGSPVQLGIFIIESPQNVLLVIGMGHELTLQKNNKILDKIIKSIKPI
jgi:hypothetical protein